MHLIQVIELLLVFGDLLNHDRPFNIGLEYVMDIWSYIDRNNIYNESMDQIMEEDEESYEILLNSSQNMIAKITFDYANSLENKKEKEIILLLVTRFFWMNNLMSHLK